MTDMEGFHSRPRGLSRPSRLIGQQNSPLYGREAQRDGYTFMVPKDPRDGLQKFFAGYVRFGSLPELGGRNRWGKAGNKRGEVIPSRVLCWAPRMCQLEGSRCLDRGHECVPGSECGTSGSCGCLHRHSHSSTLSHQRVARRIKGSSSPLHSPVGSGYRFDGRGDGLRECHFDGGNAHRGECVEPGAGLGWALRHSTGQALHPRSPFYLAIQDGGRQYPLTS